MKIKDLEEQIKKLNVEIRKTIVLSTYQEAEDLSGLDIDYENPDELLLLDEYSFIMAMLSDIQKRLNYLQLPVVCSGKLKKNAAGRYELDNSTGVYFTSGTAIEYLCDDQRYATPHWQISSIEYDGADYYIVDDKNTNLDGLEVRIRKG